jgi:hypothetical protein
MPSRYEIWYGRDEPPVARRELRAGPVRAELDGGDIRYIRAGDVELVRRIYVAVRDLNWNTIGGKLTSVEVEDHADSFTVHFDCRHQHKDIDFAWHGTIIGSPDGSIRYSMDGTAQSNFRYAKIGICIHHPIRECAGRPFSGRTPDGPVSGTLPLTIGPQVHLDDGTDLPLFTPVESLEIDLGAGLAVQFAFAGDLFEMEDQRNWTDASFKTASTPASLGYVHEAQAGTQIHQSVTVRIAGAPISTSARPQDLRVTIGDAIGRKLPSIGLGMASHGGELSPREVDLLRRLRLGHLRVDLHLGDAGYRDELHRAARACQAIDCGLELAVFLDDASEARLDELAALLRAAAVPVRRVLVFREGEEVAAGRWVRLVRERLRAAAPHALFVGGTDIYFNELNRNRPEIEAMDAVTYSINPQIHAFDEASLVEALEGQAETVTSARAFCGDLPLVISPITLKPRFNAVATVPEGERAPDQLPDQVDPRQMSLFGAAWIVGSVKYLAESGASSLTYYETTGWRGVMETEGGSPPAMPFPSRPGMVFPLYHVLADLGEWPSGDVLDCRTNAVLTVNGLAVQVNGARHVLLANMTAVAQEVTIGPLAAERVALRRLNEDTVRVAMFEPDRFRTAAGAVLVRGKEMTVTVGPYEVVRIDTQA